MEQEKLCLFGKEFEDLASLIKDQIEFNNKLKPSDLYDEINQKIHELEGFTIVTTTKLVQLKNIDKIYQSQNFKYALQFPYLILLNKYHE